jgi:hypothetical protein
VIDHGQRLLRLAHLAAGEAKALEGLRRRHLVNEMPVDVEQARAIRLRVHHVVVPDLVVEGARLGHLLRPAVEKIAVQSLAAVAKSEKAALARSRHKRKARLAGRAFAS